MNLFYSLPWLVDVYICIQYLKGYLHLYKFCVFVWLGIMMCVFKFWFNACFVYIFVEDENIKK